MPNWDDNEGRFWWKPPGKYWFEAVEVPHAPLIAKKGCKCAFCEHKRKTDVSR